MFSGGQRRARRIQRHPATGFFRYEDERFVISLARGNPHTGPPDSFCSVLVATIPVGSPPPPVSSFCNDCTPSRAPTVGRGRFDRLLYGQIHEPRKRRGCDRKDSKGFLKTRLASMVDEENKRMLTGDDALGASVTLTGKGGRPPADVAEALI